MKSSGTTVTFLKRSDGALLGYRANGHSGYAEAGADIVCAAISILCAALDASCQSADGYKSTGTGGNGEFFARYDGHSRAINAHFDMLITGLYLLANTYPQNIKISTA